MKQLKVNINGIERKLSKNLPPPLSLPQQKQRKVMKSYFMILISLLATISGVSADCYHGCICMNLTVSCNKLNLTSADLLKITHMLPKNTSELIVDFNDIDEIPTHNLPVLPGITKVSFRYNRIGQIPMYLEKKFPNLTMLDLSGNDLNRLNSFKHPKLEDINLNNNNLKYLKGNPLKFLPNLRKLSIESNDLQYIDKLTFMNSTKLRILKLAGNKITALKAGTFDSFSRNNNIILDLSSNQLESIPADLLVFEDVNYIDISENEIWSIDDKAFDTILNVVGSINLQHNVLETPPLFTGIAIGKINLIGNPLVCDCKLAARLKQFEIQFQGVCQHPSKKLGKHLADIKLEDTCTYCEVFNPCSNNGKCVSYANDTFECICDTLYTGKTCQLHTTLAPSSSRSLCNNTSCPENSFCNQNTNNTTFNCECLKGYRGPSCAPFSLNHDDDKVEEIVDRSNSRHIYIIFGCVLFGGASFVFCVFYCLVKRFYKHESYMVVPSERTKVYGGL